MLDKPDKFGWTPISLAAQNGQTRVISVLITAGADPNIGEPNEGRTPLHFAAELGHLEVVKVLLTASPKVDVPYKGKCPRTGFTIFFLRNLLELAR